MPRFFFHVSDGFDLPDEEGHEMPGVTAAKREALRYAGRLIGDLTPEFWDHDEWRMAVTDEAGLTVFCLVFAGHDAPAQRDALTRFPGKRRFTGSVQNS